LGSGKIARVNSKPAALRIALGVLLVVAALATAAAADEVSVGAGRLLDIENGRMRTDIVVRIVDGRVTSVETRRPGESVTHDLGDVTLLPGLVDCHVHLIGGTEQTPYEDLRETTARAAIEGVANARATIEAGFTTVRDLGSRDFADVALRDAIAAGHVVGPRMLVAVKSLSSTGGHGDRNDLPADISVQRYSAVADGADQIAQKVRENVRYGADWIKVLATGGVMSAGTDPKRADYTEAELRAAVEAARERGREVAAHAHGTEGILRAARAGVRSIEHASMLNDEAVALLKRSGTFVVINPYTNAYMLERGAAGGYQPYQLEKSRQIYQMKLESLRRAVKGGLLVAYGTDAGVQPHGLNGKQLANYVEAGMSPLQALQSATLVAAKLLRMQDKIGKVTPGAFGDLVGVAGDPLRDIRTVEQPLFVMKEGVVVLDRTATSTPGRVGAQD
jgi:imidazolonepropionase-like amidohydrolase